MKSKYLLIMVSVCFLIGVFVGIGACAEQTKKAEPEVFERVDLQKLQEMAESIKVTGRLSQDLRLSKEMLFLTAKDSETYLIQGDLVSNLKQALVDLGENNIVSVAGVKDGRQEVTCNNKYSLDKEKKPIDSKCVRSYLLKVTQIIETKTSEEQFPEPKRDSKEESKAESLAAAGASPVKPYGLIQRINREAVVTSVNLKSVVKTVGIKFTGEDGKSYEETLIITSETQFLMVNKLDKNKPMPASINSLKPKQKVSVLYTLDFSKVPQRATADAIGIMSN